MKTDGTYTEKNIPLLATAKIYARACISRPKTNFPLVIYSHGLGASVEHDEEYENLGKVGVAVFGFEFAGGSSSTSPKAKGHDGNVPF